MIPKLTLRVGEWGGVLGSGRPPKSQDRSETETQARGENGSDSRSDLDTPAPPPSIQNSQRSWDARFGKLVVLTDSDGVSGYGEATPLPGYGPAERDFDDWGKLPWVMLHDGASSALGVPSGIKLPPSVRFAVETALFDLRARRAGMSFARWLGGSQVRDTVQENGLAGMVGQPDAWQKATELVTEGIRSLKFKAIGREPHVEAEWLMQLRGALDEDRPLGIRLDLNGALGVAEARQALEVYAMADVEFVEEPASGIELLELRECVTPWFADESLSKPGLADALLDDSVCSGFVLKPTVLGGIFRCRDLGRRADDVGKSVVVTHCFEGPVALAACAQLGRCLPGEPLACGVAPHEALDAFFPALPNESGDGLGIDIDIPDDWDHEVWTFG